MLLPASYGGSIFLILHSSFFIYLIFLLVKLQNFLHTPKHFSSFFVRKA